MIGCSSSTEETKKEDEIQKEEYVFDAAAADTTSVKAEIKTIVPPAAETAKKFIVQIGAFTAKDRANEYAVSARKKLSKEIIVSYSDEFKLYVVQLPPYATKAEAQSVRDALWNTKDFKDAFIVVLP